MADGTGISILEEAACRRRLADTPIARVAFVVDGRPVVLPVNYRWFDGAVVFRVERGRRLHAAAQGGPVCVEIDGWNAHDRSGWSVLVTGTAREVTGWAEREQLEQLDLVPWSDGPWRACWVRVEPSEITGRGFG